jgi:Ca2+-binding RTX toxin-like protein
MFGGAGADSLYGGTENDILLGNAGNDFLYGDEENLRDRPWLFLSKFAA